MSKKNTVVLSARELQARAKKGFTKRIVREEDIDYSDIPKFSEDQLKQFKPVGAILTLSPSAKKKSARRKANRAT
jgi:hypothetical protein